MISSLALLGLLIAAAPPVPTAVYVRGEGEAAQGTAAIVEVLVEEALDEDPRYLPLRAADDGPGAVDPYLEVDRARAAARVAEARIAFFRLEPERASTALAEASDLYLRHLDMLPNLAEAAEAVALHGVVLNQAGDAEAASEQFRALLFFAPEFDPSGLDAVGPEEQALLEAVRSDLESEAWGRLVVTWAKPGAQVWLDGRLIGSTPLEVPVPPGRHVFAMRRHGFEREAGVFTMAPGGEVTITRSLHPRPSRVAENEALDRLEAKKPSDFGAVLPLLERAEEAREMVFVHLESREDGLRARVFRLHVETRDLLATETATLPQDIENLKPALQALLTRILAPEPPDWRDARNRDVAVVGGLASVGLAAAGLVAAVVGGGAVWLVSATSNGRSVDVPIPGGRIILGGS